MRSIAIYKTRINRVELDYSIFFKDCVHFDIRPVQTFLEEHKQTAPLVLQAEVEEEHG